MHTSMELCLSTAIFILVSAFYGSVHGDGLTVTFLHTNDVHTRFEETDGKGGPCSEELQQRNMCYGGVARRATSIREVREKYRNVLLVDAGDQFQGPTLWFYVYKGMATAHFMNLLQYDVMALGNHEFDNGIGDVRRFILNASFPLVSCNMNSSEEPMIDELFTCSHIVDIGGEKLTFVGYTTLTTRDVAKPGLITFSNEINALQVEVSRLTSEEGVNKIIALGHSGYEIDLEIARRVQGIDVVIGGHSHTFLHSGHSPISSLVPGGEYPTIVTPEYNPAKRVPVVQAYAYGTFLGRLTVTFNDDGDVISSEGAPVLLDNDIPKDPEMLLEFEEWNEVVDATRSKIVGVTAVELKGDRSICGGGECNIGNLIADSWVSSFVSDQRTNSDGWTRVSLAVINADSIGASIQRGNITVGMVNQVLPYGDTVNSVTLRGDHIIELLETAVAQLDEGESTGTFLQVSGMRIEYDLLRPPMQRVMSVQVVCSSCLVSWYAPIDEQAEYKVAMNDFMAGGGGGFAIIRERKLGDESGDLDLEILINHVQDHVPITTGLEGRIIVYDSQNRPPHNQGSRESLPVTGCLIAYCVFVALRTP